MTVLEMVAIIQRTMQCEHLQPDIQNTAFGEIYSQFLDSTRAQAVLSWKPHFTLETGLRETVEWYRQYMEAFIHHDS